jgi:glycosyltransferase involved in cell wall biosynthesis
LRSPDYVIKDVDEGVHVYRFGPFFLKQKEIKLEQLDERVKAAFRRRIFEQMVRVLQSEPVDAALSFYLLNAGFLGLYVSRELGVPLVAGVRGNDIGRNIFHVERFAVIQWIVQGAQRVVCVNEHLRRRVLLAWPEVRQRISVIPNSVEPLPVPSDKLRNRTRIAELTGWSSEDLWLTFVGTLREKKGVTVLTRALLALPASNRARLLVVGPDLGAVENALCGPEWSRLREEGRIYVTGNLHRAEVPEWVGAADVVVMPSLDDGMANGLLEGMMLGLCPLATHVFTDVLEDQKEGLLVPTGDSSRLADAILFLESHREMAAAWGLAARQRVLAWQPRDEAERYLGVLREALQDHSGVEP